MVDGSGSGSGTSCLKEVETTDEIQRQEPSRSGWESRALQTATYHVLLYMIMDPSNQTLVIPPSDLIILIALLNRFHFHR